MVTARNRVVAPLVTLAMLVLLGVTGTGLYMLARHSAAQDPTATTAPVPPLLPGAPKLAQPAPVAAASVPPLGHDVSFPQCRTALPAGGYGIVGLTGGKPLSSNVCAGPQLGWAAAKQGHAVYVNTGWTGTGDPVAYGRRVIDDAIAREHATGRGGTAVWWLDVETVNTWLGTPQQNATVLDAMAARLLGLGARVGIYSTPKMWAEIAGGWAPGLPVWYATGPGTMQTALSVCNLGFAGSATAIAQWVQRTSAAELDHDVICPAFTHRAAELLDLG